MDSYSRLVRRTIVTTSSPFTILNRPGSGDDEEGPAELVPFNPIPADREDLPYKVELWDEAKRSLEQILAITASGSIGYAAYYAATREFPQRYITLRHNNRIVARWNGPGH